jgi:membrane glycosyltransferase
MDAAMNEHNVLPLKPVAGMPPREPLAMPVQDLRNAPPRQRMAPARGRVWLARLVAFGGGAAVTAYGTYEMIQVVSIGGVTVLEGIMSALFAVTFGWIALAATSALAGLLAPPARHARLPEQNGRLTTNTALAMPIYHEDPVRTTAALQAMAEGLADLGQAEGFEIVILSDSTGADAWVAETLAVDRLRSALRDVMPVWYRRRWANTGKKAGNVKDFVEQWGGRYDHFIVLDADSLMAPKSLVALAASMEVDPDLGILQTVPVLAGGRTLFARLQQFAGSIYGPIVSRGMAAWQGSDGNYWGHNAIIRTRAFAEACGLPELPGKKPFGGPILSHDFVEAALMRRAGWRVDMASRLGGSYEESPPSLIDTAVRDRRWAQGNLQHSKVISARGLSWVSRVHLGIGIMSYLASPLWLALIGFGFALSVQARFIRPEYFSDTIQLFPSWPHFDSERMVQLFIFTMVVLLLPKALGLLRGLLVREVRRGCGGALRLIGSSLTELVVSALLAPIMMVIHSRHVFEILAGRDSGWAAQRRDDGETGWRDAWLRHRWQTAAGLAFVITAWFLSPAILAWLSPTLAGLFLAVPLSRASGSRRVGAALWRLGLLVTPEESAPDPLYARREEIAAEASRLAQDPIAALAADESLRHRHFSWIATAPRMRGKPDASLLTAAEKIREAHSFREALDWLDARERLQVAGHPALAEELARLAARGEPPPSPTKLHVPSFPDRHPEPQSQTALAV